MLASASYKCGEGVHTPRHPELDSGSQEQTDVTKFFPGWGRCHVVTDGGDLTRHTALDAVSQKLAENTSTLAMAEQVRHDKMLLKVGVLC